MYLLRSAVLIIGVISMTLKATSQSSPEAAVRAYCTFDGEGAAYGSHQLHAQDFDRLQVNAVEAAWDESTIVKDFKIAKVTKKQSGFKVLVIYRVLGTITSDLTLLFKPSNETVTFDVVRVAGEWKIDHSEIEPHITKSGIIAILQSQESDATQKEQVSADADMKEQLSKLNVAIKIIKKW